MTVNFTLRAESGSLAWFWVLWVELPSDGLSHWAAPRSLSRGWLERWCGEENSVTLSVLALCSGCMSCLPASGRIRVRIASHRHHSPPSPSLFLPYPTPTWEPLSQNLPLKWEGSDPRTLAQSVLTVPILDWLERERHQR